MPDLLNRSLEDMLAAMAARFGARWPNDWWPTGNSAYDDCAACVSYFLFGLNSSRNPYYSYVSQVQNFFAGQGRRTWGNQGIQRGDILAFSWSKDPNSFDHTEIALGPVSPLGLITSRGTNSNPGDDLRDRTRSAAYVVSFARPAYPGSSITAGSGSSSIIAPATAPALPVTRKAEDMFLYKQTQGSLVTYILWIPGKARYQTTRDVAVANTWSELVGYSAREISSAAVSQLFDNITPLFSK